MNRNEFVKTIEDALKAPAGTFQESDYLENLEGWDSIGALSVIAVIDEDYGVTLGPGALVECNTVADLAALVKKGCDSR